MFIKNTRKIAIGNIYLFVCFLKTFRLGDGKREWETKYFFGNVDSFMLRRPLPSPRVCKDEGRSYGDVITKFLGLMGYQL